MVMAAATFAIGAASSVIGFAAQKQQVSRANTTGLINQSVNTKTAYQSFENQDRDISRRQLQEQDAATTQKFDNDVMARKAVATNVVAAGESGIGTGLSTQGVLRDIYRQSERANDRITQNTDWTLQELQAQKRTAGYQTRDRINGFNFQPYAQPSFADAGLKIVAGGVDAYSKYKSWSA